MPISKVVAVTALVVGLSMAAPTELQVRAPAELQRRAPHQVTWDCTNTPESCNNACYAVACKGKSWTLTYLGPEGNNKYDPNDPNSLTATEQRRRSGAGIHPCASGESTYPNVKRQDNDASMVITDEYPFASSKEGGKGAILRCTTNADSQSQAVQTSQIWNGVNKGEQVTIKLTTTIPDSSPFCAPYLGGKNAPSAQSICDNAAGYEFLQDPSTIDAPSGTKKKFNPA